MSKSLPRAEMPAASPPGRTGRETPESSAEVLRLRALLANVQGVAQVGSWDWNLVTHEFACSDEACRILGIEPREFGATYEVFLAFVHRDDRAAVQGAIDAGLERREPFEVEHRVARPDGSERVVREHGVVAWNEDRPVNVLGTVLDVTEHRRQEQEIQALKAELKNRAIELAAANEELETFAQSVSHDLRAPLCAIDGFGLALVEDYPEQLDERGRDYVARLRGATKRLGALIDELLVLSRISRSALARRTVDLSALAHEIAVELRGRGRGPERAVEVRIEDGLSAEGDPPLLRVVLENLLGNAWKFTAPHERALIEFRATEHGGAKAFFVRDDGVGFDMAYADKLFAPFQRLHRAEEFPGDGIGLATVRRIVRRHGGDVWAEGEPGHGATFSFSLGPKGDR